MHPSVRHQVRGTLATRSQRYWKKFKCRRRLSMVSCTPDKALQCGHSKCSPGACSMRNSKRLGSPSNRHSATRHCLPSPSAAVKNSSGVILLTAVNLTKNANLRAACCAGGHSAAGHEKSRRQSSACRDALYRKYAGFFLPLRYALRLGLLGLCKAKSFC
jgi:hypothetical protein